MGTKSYQIRLFCDPEAFAALRRTHEVFNRRLEPVLRTLFRMRRGEAGETAEQRELYREIGRFITASPSQQAPYLLNSVSIRDWTPTSARGLKAVVDGLEIEGASWADRAAALSAEGRLAFEKSEMFAGLPGWMVVVVVRDAVAALAGHAALNERWSTEHAEWLERRRVFEADPENGPYLALRPRFEAFEAEAGRVSGGRLRWAQYRAWLSANPDFAAWRGGPAIVNPISDDARVRIERSSRRARAGAEVREFFLANPELAALDRLHAFYEKTFVRRHARKRNADGFEHRPTFTMPDPVTHPRHVVFPAPQSSPSGYRDLRLPDTPSGWGSIALALVGTDGSVTEWRHFRFRADPRLAAIRPVEHVKTIRKGVRAGETKAYSGYEYFDPGTSVAVPCEVKGARLVLRSEGESGARCYLSFTVVTKDRPWTEAAKALRLKATDGGTKEASVPDGLVTCAANLGVRQFAHCTLAAIDSEGPRIVRSRNLWLEREEEKGRHPGRRSHGPSLAHIAEHQRTLRALKSTRGRAVRGERSHIGLTRHVAAMRTERVRQQARAIVDFAVNRTGDIDPKTDRPYPRADVLVLERLEGLIPSSERARGINRAIVAWNRGQLVERVRLLAAEEGIRVVELSPVGSSQVCSRCGKLGRRYRVERDPQAHGTAVVFDSAGNLFACPCGYAGVSAEHNASVNLHRRLARPDALAAFAEHRALGVSERRAALAAIEAALIAPEDRRRGLVGMHGAATARLSGGQ